MFTGNNFAFIFFSTLKLTELGLHGKGGASVTSRVEPVHLHARAAVTTRLPNMAMPIAQ